MEYFDLDWDLPSPTQTSVAGLSKFNIASVTSLSIINFDDYNARQAISRAERYLLQREKQWGYRVFGIWRRLRAYNGCD
jgi:hypothetical protein